MKIGDKYSRLLLDADDTVFDFKKCEKEALMSVCADEGFILSDDDVRIYSEINESMWKMLERGEIGKEELKRRRFAEFARVKGYGFDPEKVAVNYEEKLSYTGYLLPGAEEACRRLSGRYSLYFITNGLKSVQERRLGSSPVMKYFAKAYISGEIGFNKPSAKFFDAVAADIPGFGRHDTLVVGDSLTSDIRGGAGDGMDTCWINPSGSPVPDGVTYSVRSLAGLPGLLETEV